MTVEDEADTEAGETRHDVAAGGKPHVRTPKKLLFDSRCPDRAVRLYGVLQGHVNRHTAQCNPTEQRLATLLDWDRSKVKRALAELEMTRYVGVERPKRTDSNQYRLYPDGDGPGPRGRKPAPSDGAVTDPREGSILDHREGPDLRPKRIPANESHGNVVPVNDSAVPCGDMPARAGSAVNAQRGAEPVQTVSQSARDATRPRATIADRTIVKEAYEQHGDKPPNGVHFAAEAAAVAACRELFPEWKKADLLLHIKGQSGGWGGGTACRRLLDRMQAGLRTERTIVAEVIE